MNPSLLYLHREDVSRALPPVRDLTDTVERAFALHARAGILTAPKGALVTARGDYFGSLTALSAELGYGCCQNTLSASREHAGDSHHIRGLAILTDAKTFQPVAVMDAFWPATWLPAAVSAVAARRLARHDAGHLGLIATGEQARVHLLALAAERPLTEVRAWNRGRAGGEAFVEWARDQGHEVTLVATPREAIEGADLVVSSVPHANDLEPFIDPAWVTAGAFVSVVDLGRSWLPGLVDFDRVVCDDRAQADSQHRLGRLKFAGPYDADLADLMAGRSAGREDDAARVAFVHPGHAVGLLAIAIAVYERALDRGIGARLSG